jgi:hypothetical protein
MIDNTIEIEYIAVGTHGQINIDTQKGCMEGHIMCSVCEEEIDYFYCGYNVSEYDTTNLVCEEWDCWKAICIDANYDSLSFGDYPEHDPDNNEDLYHIIEEEMGANGRWDIKENNQEQE